MLLISPSKSEVRKMRIVLTAAAWMFCLPTIGDEAKVLTVCEGLVNLSIYNMKEVTLRGLWIGGEHGSVLIPSKSCGRSLVTEGFTWPNCVNLQEDVLEKVDVRSLAAMSLELERIREEIDRYSITVNVVGRLETRVPLQVARSADGALRGLGFGHMNRCPAELRYRSVNSILLQRKSRRD
jgi:hypothetical protein